MLAKKNSIYGAIILFALGLFLAGCTPAGPRAFFNGKKYLDRGDYANAAAAFKTATTLLATNAQVWNYYGVALAGANQPQAAANAYQRALELDRDLVEAHFNLGNLWLRQNQLDAAKTEFTAYTLRRNNDAEGWLKLGSVQLKLGETAAAERSFSSVLALKPADADAYNGLGLARVQRGMPRDAVKFFAAAVQSRPDFAAAILNLATVGDQYLHDDRTALKNYRAYLALNPRPANWDEVNALANRLEQAPAPAPPAAKTIPVPPAVAESNHYNPPAPAPVTPQRPPPKKTYAAPRPVISDRTEPKKSSVRNSEVGSPVKVAAPPVQVVQVQPPPQIVASPHAVENTSAPPVATASVAAVSPADQPPVEVPMPAEPKKRGFWHRLFGSSKKTTAVKSVDDDLTPLSTDHPASAAKPVESSPAPAPTPHFARYQYTSPRKPAPGDHANGSPAAGAFTRAELYEQDTRWPDALREYQSAAAADPSWFEAQYNTAVLAQRLRMYSLALPHYETALAIRPDSTDARYNFALALKAEGYVPDAVNELKKILSANPSEVRAHLALANIYAQKLHDPAAARPHYERVLKLEPDNPQAANIRYWLAANPK